MNDARRNADLAYTLACRTIRRTIARSLRGGWTQTEDHIFMICREDVRRTLDLRGVTMTDEHIETTTNRIIDAMLDEGDIVSTIIEHDPNAHDRRRFIPGLRPAA